MIHFDPQGLVLADLLAIARQDIPADFSQSARQRIDEGHRLLVKLAADGTPIYGVNTGLGAAVDTPVAPVQASIPLGRAVGVGRLANRQELRAITATRLAGLAQGRSGISPAAAQALLDLLNSGVEPEVPLLGSLGESDLAPLSHLSLALAVPLTGKDGLALVSANAASVGLGALLVAEAQQALEAVLAALALSCEGYRANLSAFQPWASRLRPAPGQTEQSAALLRLLAGGELADNPRRLQDPLSFRCATVVQGAAQQALHQLHELIELELRSGADNPALISEEALVLATANFDSTHLALAAEGLGLALNRVAACSAERIAKLLSPGSSDLPRFLITQPGHVGMAALQRTSSALVAEIGHLANPLPAVSVPVADRVEDYAGQALAVVDKTRRLVERVVWLVSIELIVAAQAVDLRGALRLGQGSGQIHAEVRSQVAHLDQDRSGSVDVLALSRFISTHGFSAANAATTAGRSPTRC